MIQTAPRLAPKFLGKEFNPFLFAPIGTDRNGAQLSVVSALARLDLDAWAEAASLARLPHDAAVSKLSSMLRKFTEIPQITQEAGAIAARLVALLPGGIIPKRLVPPPSAPIARTGGAAILGLLAALFLMIALQFALHAPSLHAQAAAASDSSSSHPPASKTP